MSQCPKVRKLLDIAMDEDECPVDRSAASFEILRIVCGLEKSNEMEAERMRRIAILESENSKLVEKDLARGRSLPDRLDAIEDFIERFKRGMNDLK